MSKELKPCPFCGSVEVKLVEDTETDAGWILRFVECGQCHARGQMWSESPVALFSGKESAVAAWNRRPSPWVPCAERLPGIGLDILARTVGTDGGYLVTWLMDDGRWFYEEGDLDREDVTHWMPIPPLPEEEK